MVHNFIYTIFMNMYIHVTIIIKAEVIDLKG